MFLTIIGTIIIATILLITFILFKNYLKWKHIPGIWQITVAPFRIPLLAPHLFVGDQQYRETVIRKYGDPETNTLRVITCHGGGILFSDPKLLKEIYITKGSFFDKPMIEYEAFNIFGVNILSALDNETWKKHHKVCAPAFSIKNLEHVCETAVKSMDLLMERKWKVQLEKKSIKVKGKEGFELDLGDYSDVTLDVLGKAGFGIDLSIFTDDTEGRKFRVALETFVSLGVIVRRFLFSYPWLLNIVERVLGLSEKNKLVSDRLDEIIERKQKELKNEGVMDSNDLLSLLVEANNQEKGLLSQQEIKSNAAVFALAGHETTSTLLQWLTYELAKHPEVQERARKEIDQVLENKRSPTYEDIGKLNYINAIIYEGLRQHPPVPTVFKIAKKDVQIGKFKIPKDTSIALLIYSVNRSEKLYENPTEFKPERFLDNEVRQKIQHDFTWIPFSMGSRKCIGFQFALFEAIMMLTRIIQFYEFTLLNDESKEQEKVNEISFVTTRPGNLRVLVKERQF
ncbi:hypothetical protein ABK040_011873 [Willaertia magna]